MSENHPTLRRRPLQDGPIVDSPETNVLHTNDVEAWLSSK